MNASPKKVLVVENDEGIVVLISHILARSSYVVHTTLDALEADHLLERDDYDAVLLDLKMPNGGVELIQKIERRNPELLRKVIVVTAAMDELAKIAGKPVYGVVRKPFDIEQLLEIVRGCVEPAS